MRNQTVKFGKLRLARFETVRVYSYEGTNFVRRAGVYGKGK